MPRPRKLLVDLGTTPYYHVVSRCVRRAFLCGTDRVSGNSYEHRRAWLQDRVRVLSTLFSVEICAFAIMSNHYHLVVKLNPEESEHWTDDDVLNRWTALFKGTTLIQRYQQDEPVTAAEAETLKATINVYRQRLTSLSWFMKCLNEPIARRANQEDKCTGHFWESRFLSQALCSDRALLSAMVYVDLNPIRAGIAKTPEHSEFTSVRARINKDEEGKQLRQAVAELLKSGELNHLTLAIRPLAAFANEKSATLGGGPRQTTIPITWPDYLQLVDSTGRIGVHGKRGRIPDSLSPVLERIGLSNNEWLDVSTRFERVYRNGDVRLAKAS
ncbi:MAG: hypothetical protein AAGH76_13920 [Pseudomonadota bacterium]